MLPLRGAAEAVHLRRRPLLRGFGFLQPPVALLCADRSETRQGRPSGPGANADVRELLRSLRENRRGEFHHRHRALQAEEQGAGGNHPPQGRQHPRTRVSALPPQQRRVAAKAHGVDRGSGMKAMNKRAAGKAGWQTKKLGDICDFEGGSQPPKSQFIYEKKPGYVRFLQIRDFGNDKNITFIPDSKKNRGCEQNDILIGRYGASVGKILTSKAGAYNVALMKTIPNLEVLDRSWFYNYLISDEFQSRLLNVADRSAQDGFSKDDIYGFPVPDRKSTRLNSSHAN